MTAELIYRTTSPAAEAWWRAAQAKLDEQRLLRNAFEEEMTATYGLPQKNLYGEREGRRALYTNGKVITGLDSGYNEYPPEGSGWRLDSKDHHWKPALRTPEGKALQKRISSLTLYILQKHVREVGIPEMVWGDRHVYWAGLEHDENPFVLYQTWGSGICAKGCLQAQAEHPEIVWEEVPRSEWYARIEAEAAATEPA